jgi:heme oxygenase
MSFWDRSKGLINQGVMSSREILDKAREKTKELGEKGVAKFEIAQLEKQAEKRFAQIGRHVYEVLVKEGQQTVSRGTTEIKKLLQDVEEIEQTIDDKEKDL